MSTRLYRDVKIQGLNSLEAPYRPYQTVHPPTSISDMLHVRPCHLSEERVYLHFVLPEDLLPQLCEALRVVAKRREGRGIGTNVLRTQSFLGPAAVCAEYDRAWLWGEQRSELACELGLLFLIEEVEE